MFFCEAESKEYTRKLIKARRALLIKNMLSGFGDILPFAKYPKANTDK